MQALILSDYPFTLYTYNVINQGIKGIEKFQELIIDNERWNYDYMGMHWNEYR